MKEMNSKILFIGHGDFDGVASVALLAKQLGIPAGEVRVIFTQPFLVEKLIIPDDDIERIFVVDIAMNNRDVEMTRKFIQSISNRLERWYDHHQGWQDEFVNNNKFILKDKPACAAIIGSTHWTAPESAVVADAIAADTRKGELSPHGLLIEQAMKANMADDSIRVAAVKWLLGDESQKEILEKAAEKYAAIQKETMRLAGTYEMNGKVAIVDARGSHEHDLTQLLLAGQKLAEFALAKVVDPRTHEERITVATQGKTDLVKLFGLPSGSSSRVSLEATRLPEVLEKFNAPEPGDRLCNCGAAKVMQPHEHTQWCG